MPVRSKDPVLRFGQQVETESNLTEELGATWRESVSTGPLGSAIRMIEMDMAESGQGQSATSVARFGYLPNIPKASPMISRAEAQARIKEEGMEGALAVPESGIRSGALDILISRKREEQSRNTIRQQSPGGAGRFAANLMVGFAGQLVDPVNVAASFIPVVGPGRYAAMLSKAGSPLARAGVRGSVGALEGTVGAAVVEPLSYYANRQQQADYDAFDSAINIAGGAFFGSALHAGAGLFGDMIRPPRPFERAPEPATPGTGQPVSKAPEFDPRELALQRERTIVLDRLADGRPLTRKEAIAAATAKFEDIGGFRARIEGKGEVSLFDSVAPKGADFSEFGQVRQVEAYDGDQLVGKLTYANDGTPPTVEVAETHRRKGIATAMYALARQKGGVLGDAGSGIRGRGAEYRTPEGQAFRGGADESKVTLTKLDVGDHPKISAEADRLLGDGESLSKEIIDEVESDKFREIRPMLASLPRDTQEAMFRMALAQAVTGRPIDVSPGLFAHYGDADAAADAAMRNAGEVAGADHVASQAADARLKEAKDDLASLKEQASEEEAMLREQAQASGIEDIDDMMSDAADAAAIAKAQTEAVKIATLCMLRNG
jgi:hypothetical protein